MREINELNNKELMINEYMKEAKDLVSSFYNGKIPKVWIETFGCQMNEHDSEKILWMLEEIGFEEGTSEKESDFVIYNTCAVRENAENKVFGKLGELKRQKRENEDLLIAVCGCMTQIEETTKVITSKYRHVDIIFGTNNIQKLPELLIEKLKGKKRAIDIHANTEIYENLDANRLYPFKAFVNIIYGCNNFCSYCIVPYTRGREASREPEYIIEEIKRLVKGGTKEITLLGQNVNSYGKTLEKDYNFVDLLTDINNIEGLERLRFMTSHPKDISNELIDAYGKLDKLCRHLHLPVQSGSNRLLKEMNRKYTREDYLEKIRLIRKVDPNISISTDIIVGYPGETEEDFNDTLSLVKEVEYDSAFTFLYSMREGTPAAKKSNQIPEDIKNDRFQRLLDVINPIAHKKNEAFIDREVEVLVDSVSKNNDEVLTGRTTENKIVNFVGDKSLIGKFVKVKIDEAKTFTLEGRLVD